MLPEVRLEKTEPSPEAVIVYGPVELTVKPLSM
jgi:hypothetical protein